MLGSRNLQNFDPALVIYTFAIIFATWGVIYHYSVWIRKPPTYVYWQRGWQLFKEQGVIRSARSHRGAGGNSSLRSNVHRATLQTALGDASVDVLGMHPGGDDYLSAGIRMDLLHQRSERSDDLCDSPVRVSDFQLSSAHLHRVDSLSWPGYFGISGSGRHCAFAVAPDARRGSTSGADIRYGFLPLDLALCYIDHRPGSDGFASRGWAAVSTISSPSCTPSR